MLLWDDPESVNTFVGQRGGGYAHPGSYTALGWLNEHGKLVAGLVFYDCNGVNCLVNIAVEGGSFPPGLLKAGLFYVFRQLKLRRLTFSIAASNIRSLNLVTALGSKPEATLRDAAPDGNMLIYALFPEDCKIWSRLNGKISRVRPGSPES